MRDQRLEKLAEVLVNYSTKVKKGDNVFITAEDVAIPFIIAVAKASTKAGGIVEYVVELPEVKEDIIKNGDDLQVSQPNNIMGRAVKEGDVWLSSWASKNLRAHNNLQPERMTMNKKANVDNRKVYRERTGDGSLRWCGTQFPTDADAQEAEMSLEEYEDFVYEAGHINEADPIAHWEKIAEEQERWVKYLDTKSEIIVKGKDVDLRVSTKGRTWINCCGLVNFPDGEIYTSPDEHDIDGTIAFSFPAIYDGHLVENVAFEIKAGKVVKATATKGEEYLHEMLKLDEGASRFGEFAIGTNYGIKKFTRNMLFDEKIGGTIHMALGSSFPKAGGVNDSAIHWDMICDMREDGEIFADGELFYKNGEFIDEVLGGESV